MDSSGDIFRSSRQPLEAVFAPKRVAVVGASERAGSVGRQVLTNLVSSPFGGTVYPVSTTRGSVLGIQAHPTVADLPEPPDLAVIAVPAAQVPEVIGQCGEAGARAAIVLSAGFREVGEEGAALERRVLAEARRTGIRVVGPSTLGVMRPPTGLNASFARGGATAGRVAFVSQSGALLGAVLDWSTRESVGFSALVCTGTLLDVGWGELIHHLGDDPHTTSILVYMETIDDARSLLTAAREVALRKPVIVMRAGRATAASRAVVSHTGALAGSDAALDAAFRRTGVLRVDSVADLFYAAEVLSKQPRPRGPRLSILTNAGGPGVIAADRLVAGGGKLAELSDETVAALDALLPAEWSHGNPVDVLGDASPETYRKALDLLAADDGCDGVLAVLAPQHTTDATATAKLVAERARLDGKPLLASWMGGESTSEGDRILDRAGIPTFRYPDTAARLFDYIWRYTYNLRGIYETPALRGADEPPDAQERAHDVIERARREGRTLLDQLESKSVLDAYGIPAVETRLATTVDEAVAAAEELGYPVAVKLHSHAITHKSDVGGVRLHVGDAAAVRAAWASIRDRVESAGHADAVEGVTVQPMVGDEGYELVIGSTTDPQLGPVIAFGAGGRLVEVYRDRALALPPLNQTLARRMMEQTRVARALDGVRGLPAVDRDALESLLVRFAQMIVEQPLIAEMDVNPLLAAGDRLVALDARVVVHPPERRLEDLPRPAIRPYPAQYVGYCTTKDGERVEIRPIRPEDEPALVRFHGTLSEDSVHMRYSSMMSLDARTAHERLSRICFIDYDREMVLVAERVGGEILGIARLNRVYGTGDAEFALLVGDRFQGKGLGRVLLERLLEIGRAEGLERIIGYILPQNAPMLRTCRSLGFEMQHDRLEDTVTAVKRV